MLLSTWLLFCSVALLVCFTPGPAILLAVSNAVKFGPRATVFSSLGSVTGIFMVSGLAMAGVGAVLAASAHAFTLVKWVGALYLIYLGIKTWRSTSALMDTGVDGRSTSRASPARWRLYRQGLFVSLTNPKAILFFSAFFPQFIAPNQPILGQYLVLTSTFAVLALVSHAFYVALMRVLKHQIVGSRPSPWVNRASGGLFVALGLGLLGVHHKTV